MPSDIYRSVVVLSTVVAPLGLVGHLYIHTLAVRLYTHLLPTEGGHHPILYTHLLPTEGAATTPYCTHTYCPQRGPPPHTVHIPTAHRGGLPPPHTVHIPTAHRGGCHHPILYTHLLPTEGLPPPHTVHTPTAHRGGHHPILYTCVCGFVCRLHSSYDLAKRTVMLLRMIVSTSKYGSAQ